MVELQSFPDEGNRSGKVERLEYLHNAQLLLTIRLGNIAARKEKTISAKAETDIRRIPL